MKRSSPSLFQVFEDQANLRQVFAIVKLFKSNQAFKEIKSSSSSLFQVFEDQAKASQVFGILKLFKSNQAQIFEPSNQAKSSKAWY